MQVRHGCEAHTPRRVAQSTIVRITKPLAVRDTLPVILYRVPEINTALLVRQGPTTTAHVCCGDARATTQRAQLMSIQLRPLTLRQANELVEHFHRHHDPARGHRFSIGVYDTELDRFVGAAITGRPVAPNIDQWLTAEVTRLVTDGTPNACSMLYAASWRAWKAMGGTRIITYILETEEGTSLKAAGWTYLYTTTNRLQGWDTPSRRRTSGPQEPKKLWEVRVA